MLNLKSITEVKTEEKGDHDYHIYAVANSEPTGCPECANDAIYGHGKRTQLFMDTPIHGRRVGIFLERKRYRCRNCSKTFFQACADVNDNHRATNRLVTYIEKSAIIRTCVSVADEIGLSEGLIRGILKNYTAKLDKQYTFETPVILGIDEVHLNREMRLVLTNITERTIVDMVDNRSKKTVVSALYRFKDMKNIKIVTMDMWRPYRDAVYGSIPAVIIVIDKFHIVKMANEAVEKGRKDIKSQLTKEQALRLKKDRWLMLKRKRDLTPMQECMLDGWVDNYPELHALHTVKEGFCDIWDQHYTRTQAMAAFDAWKDSIPLSVYKYFEGMIKSVSNWHTELFNYFDHRITNAYTESANNHIKSIAKQGRGYSFEVLRARVLFVGAKHKIKPKPFKTSVGSGERIMGLMRREEVFQNFGAVFPHEADNS